MSRNAAAFTIFVTVSKLPALPDRQDDLVSRPPTLG